MRIILYFFSFFFLLASCLSDTGDSIRNLHSEKKFRNKVLRIAVRHAKDQLKDPEKKILENGSIVFSGSEMEYLVDPLSIVTGQIDEDTTVDAVITLHIFRNMILTAREHLIMINKGGKLMIAGIVDGDMKFLSIQDRIIYVETSKVDPDSPYYGCELCKEVHKYQFVGGEFNRID
jgi:hypothetical protein